MLELHCHTTYSDGTLTPEALVAQAVASGVKALAITDHDTMAGCQPAQAAAQGCGLAIIPGVEMSTVYNGRSLHILGFYPDPQKLEPCLAERLAGRKRRAQAMVDRLSALGVPVDYPEMRGGMAPGRPHIARALLEAGHVTTTQEAFERYLGDGKPAYVCYEKFSSADGIAHLLACGGVPVWAHPYLFRGGTVAEVLPELVAAGLRGIEVYHPNHSPRQVTQLLALCDRYDLLATGGSDYHGPNPRSATARAARVPQDPGLNQFRLPLTLLQPVWQAALALQTADSPNRSLEMSPWGEIE